MVGIPTDIQNLWDNWKIRGFLLTSLSLQTFLIIVSPFRKRTANKRVILSLWTGYLLADWAANFAVGLIADRQKGEQDSDEGHLLAFWAPFLLLHLGGPDTITAFALEDNALWLRHLLGLVFQVIATGYVFLLTLPNEKLWVPTMLLFFAGIIKYAERTRALYLASLDSFRESMLEAPDPGPNYAKLMEEYASRKDAKLPTQMIMLREPDKEFRALNRNITVEPLNNLEIVRKGYHFFKIFKGLIVDLIFSFRERNESRDFFHKRTPIDALGVIEIELNFMYEVLFTKVVVVHHKVGYFFRFLAFGLVVAASVLFHFRTEKKPYKDVDVGITYTLLLGAICLDIIAFLMLVFSDWTVAAFKDFNTKSFPGMIFDKLLELQKPKFSLIPGCATKPYDTHPVLSRPILFRRWSENIKRYNLISYCLKTHPEKIKRINCCECNVIDQFIYYLGVLISGIFHWTSFLIKGFFHFLGALINKFKVIPSLESIINKISQKWDTFVDEVIDYFGIGPFLDEIRYLSSAPLSQKLWELIFSELIMKSKLSEDPETSRQICSAKGEWVLKVDERAKIGQEESKLLPYVEGVDYDESLLLWHIATELCYNTDDTKNNASANTDATKNNASANIVDENRDLSKMLSDYMLYLLIMQPTMMSAVAGIGQIRFRDTCAEAKNFFTRRGIHKGASSQKKACDNILGVNTDVSPVSVKGDRSKSVLFDGCMLAKELKKMEKKKMWEILSLVWVELLSYAASHCRADSHAQQVSKGAELISIVWLLMAHLGLGDQYQINEGHARAKLIVSK